MLFNTFQHNKKTRTVSFHKDAEYSLMYITNPHFFDRMVMPVLFGCSQIVIYNGNNIMFGYHYKKKLSAAEVRNFLRSHYKNFQGSRTLYVNFIHSNKTIEKSRQIKKELLEDLLEITPDIYFDEVLYSVQEPPNQKFYSYEVIAAFRKLYYRLKKLNLMSYEARDFLNNIYYIKTKQILHHDEKTVNYYEKSSNIVSFQKNKDNPFVYEDEQGRENILLSNKEIFIYNKIIGINDINCTYYEIIYKNGKLYSEALNDEAVSKIFDNAVILHTSRFNTKPAVIFKKKNETIKIAAVNDTGEEKLELKHKTPGITQKSIKSIYTIDKCGIIILDYGENKRFFLIILPEYFKKFKHNKIAEPQIISLEHDRESAM